MPKEGKGCLVDSGWFSSLIAVVVQGKSNKLRFISVDLVQFLSSLMIRNNGKEGVLMLYWNNMILC